MSTNKFSKAIGFERFFAGQALPLASRAMLAVSALMVAPAIHADCLPSVSAAAQQVSFTMSTHTDSTHVVGYGTGILTLSSTGSFSSITLSGDNIPLLASNNLAACTVHGLSTCEQPFNVNQSISTGVAISRIDTGMFEQPPTISITLTQDSGKSLYTFAGSCDASTHLLYGSYGDNTMVVISFGAPFAKF
jgi:hypothetical protein